MSIMFPELWGPVAFVGAGWRREESSLCIRLVLISVLGHIVVYFDSVTS